MLVDDLENNFNGFDFNPRSVTFICYSFFLTNYVYNQFMQCSV